MMALGRSQARLAAITKKESNLITKEKTKEKNKGRIRVPYRTAEGRLVHDSRGKILFNEVPHQSYNWKSQKEENAEMLRTCLTLPKLSPFPRISPAGLHGRAKGTHLPGYHEGPNIHNKVHTHKEDPRKKALEIASTMTFPSHRRTSADGLIEEIQQIKNQDKLRSSNLKYSLEMNATPAPKRKDSRGERMRKLEQKIIARGKQRSEFGTDAGFERSAPDPIPSPSPSPNKDGKKKFTVGFTVDNDERGADADDVETESGFESWLSEFMSRK